MPVPRRLLLVAALVPALACRKQPEAPHGSPVLLEVAWEVDGAPMIVWSRDPDAAVPGQVPAAGSKIDFIFDRRLDGARVEDTIDGGPVPKPNPPITVGWPDMATVMSDPAFVANVFYDSLPNWGPGTSYAFVQPLVAGFPSATPVTFTLDPNGLTSVYGEPMDGPTTLTVTTTPLTLTLPTATATVPTSYFVPITLSTRAPAGPTLMSFIHVSSAGAALPFELRNDAGNSKRILIVPVGCLGGWPPNARVDVMVDAGLTDAFGRPLAAPAAGSFMTGGVAAQPVDGGCPPGDAGARDAAAEDAGIDVTADGGIDQSTDDLASDASPIDARPIDMGRADDAGADDAGADDAQSTN